MTDEEIKEVEQLVNKAIDADAKIICEEMSLEDAKKSGAIGLFESKYDNMVKSLYGRRLLKGNLRRGRTRRIPAYLGASPSRKKRALHQACAE